MCLSRDCILQNQKNRELSPDSFQFRLPGLGESSSINSFGFKAEIASCRFYDFVCVYFIYIYVCVCVFYIYVCVCVCVCVYGGRRSNIVVIYSGRRSASQ